MERKGVPDQAVFQHVGPPPTGYTSAQKLAKTSDHPVRGVVHQSRVMECHDRGTRHCLQLVGDANTKNYDGSMGDWANREDTPLEV